MDSESTRADVEARLRETADAMSDRLDSLQEEVSTTGTSVRDWMARNPLKSVGGMLAAGLAVGALFGGGRSRRPEHTELLDQYVDALREEVEGAIASGDTPGEALEKALKGRAPLVVYRDGARSEDASSGGGFLSDSLGFVARIAAREVLQNAVLSLLEDVEMDQVLDDMSIE
ncbi:MAG: hypothetical protein ABEL51_15850 [Salinibacter sp.]